MPLLTATNAMHSHLGERKGKRKEDSIYVAPSCTHTHKALRHGSHSFTCKQRHACLSFVRVYHNWDSRHPIAAYYSFIDPKRMKGWVGLVGWPIADGLPTCGHPSATGSAQDKESSPAKDRHSTIVPCDQQKKMPEFSSTAPSPYHHIWLVTFTQSSSIW